MNFLPAALTKTLVREFYRQHAGAFTVGLLLACGFMRGQEHHALATYAVHDRFMLAVYLVIWLLYALFATRFAIRTFRQQAFLQLLRLVPAGRRLGTLYGIAVQLLVPVLAYAGYVFGVGWEQKTGVSLMILAVGVPALTLVPVLILEYFLRHPALSLRIGRPFRTGLTTPFGLFFVRHLLHRQPLTLFLTKGGALGLLLGLCTLYPTDDYDLRLLLLGGLLAAALHAGLVYELYRFEAVYLRLLRNLPVSRFRRFVVYLFTLSLLLTPELGLLLRNAPEGVSHPELLGTWAFLVALVLAQYTLLLPRHRPPDRIMPLVFWLIIGYFFLIMYRLPVFGLVGATAAAAVGLFVRYYDRSEPAFSE